MDGTKLAMRLPILVVLFAAALTPVPPSPLHADSIDGRVIQVELPAEDVTLFYVERKGCFTVRLETKSASVESPKLYIGDGKVALDLVAHATNGIFLQGAKYRNGDQFKRGATIKVRPGYMEASALRPGDVYVTLPNVTFQMSGK